MTTDTEKQEALKTIAEKMAQVETLIEECKQIADDNDVSFSFDAGGYGMGGTYDGEEGEWYASSQSC